MVIGCLAESINHCPSSLAFYFDDFLQVLIKHSTGKDGSMNRNVSFGFGILADKAPKEKFLPHLSVVLQTIKNMHAVTKE